MLKKKEQIKLKCDSLFRALKMHRALNRLLSYSDTSHCPQRDLLHIYTENGNCSVLMLWLSCTLCLRNELSTVGWQITALGPAIK